MSVPAGSRRRGRSVLVVAGDRALATAVVKELERNDLTASVVPDAARGIEACQRTCLDAVVVDLGLPDGTGYRFVAELRERGNDIPVLLLSAPHAPEDLLTVQRGWPDLQPAMREGLHDVPSVLHALLHHEQPDSARRLRYAGLTLDRFERRVFAGGQEVALTPAEFGILERLLQNAEHLVTRETLLAAVWGPESEPGSNALDVHLGHVRKKLREVDHAVGIETIRGRGYVLKRRKTSTDSSAA